MNERADYALKLASVADLPSQLDVPGSSQLNAAR